MSFSRCRLILSVGLELGFDVYCDSGVCVLWSSGLATDWCPDVGFIVTGLCFTMKSVGVFICSYHCDSAEFCEVTIATVIYFSQHWCLWC